MNVRDCGAFFSFQSSQPQQAFDLRVVLSEGHLNTANNVFLPRHRMWDRARRKTVSTSGPPFSFRYTAPRSGRKAVPFETLRMELRKIKSLTRKCGPTSLKARP